MARELDTVTSFFVRKRGLVWCVEPYQPRRTGPVQEPVEVLDEMIRGLEELRDSMRIAQMSPDARSRLYASMDEMSAQMYNKVRKTRGV